MIDRQANTMTTIDYSLADVKVGDTITVPGRRPGVDYETTVTKVGRVWVTLAGRSRADKETGWIDAGRHPSPGRAMTPAVRDAHNAHQAALSGALGYLRHAGIELQGRARERAIEIAAAVREVLGGD